MLNEGEVLNEVMILMQMLAKYIKIMECPPRVLLSTPYDSNLQL